MARSPTSEAALRTPSATGSASDRLRTAHTVLPQPRPPRLPWRALSRQAAVLWVAAHAALLVISLVTPLIAGDAMRAPGVPRIPADDVLAHWNRWDAFVFYVPIAQHGYTRPVDTAFFPLYPALVHGLSVVPGATHTLLAAMLVSALCDYAAILGVLALAYAHDRTLGASLRVGRLFIALPFAFYLAAPYPTALLLALAIWALLLVQRGQWLGASMCACAAGLTHPSSIALAVPLGLLSLTALGGWQGLRAAASRTAAVRVLARSALVTLAVPLGIALYALYCWQRLGDPLAFVHAQSRDFGHHLLAPWSVLGALWANLVAFPLLSGGELRYLVDLLPVLASVALLLALWRMPAYPRAYVLFCASVLLLAVAAPVTGTHVYDVIPSTGRYLLLAVPLLFPLADWARRWPSVERAALACGWAAQALLCGYFLAGGWLP